MKSITLSLFLLVLLLTGTPLFAGGAKADPAGGASSPTPIRIFMKTHGRTYKADEANIQEIMKRTNTVLDVVMADGFDPLNLLFASNDLPDIIEFDQMIFKQYLGTGYISPLDDLLKSHGQNILKGTSDAAWKLMTVQGKIYAYPLENTRIKHYAYIRSDWLDNLGINLPGHKDYGNFGGKVITMDEYKDILIKFTRNDPDRNGKNDTYGIGATGRKTNGGWGNIYGAFGGIPGHYYISDGKAIPWVVTDQYRQGIEYLNSLWKEGVIDPEIYLATNDQAKQKMINGVSGSGVGEWWSMPHTIQVDGLQKLKPEADFIPLMLTSSDGRIAGAPDNGILSNTISVTTQSRNPEKTMEFLDFFNTDEGWYLTTKGIEELDYTIDNGFPVWTDVGTVKYNNMTLDTLYPFSNRIDMANRMAMRPLTEWTLLLRQKWEILQMDNSQPSYTSAFYGFPAPGSNDEYGVDVNNWIEQSAMAFITGETPLNDANWNNYINTWKRMGGVKILQGYIDAYNSLNGTKITAGITE
jgi:putative aldouronate transport system substrate-binding protein